MTRLFVITTATLTAIIGVLVGLLLPMPRREPVVRAGARRRRRRATARRPSTEVADPRPSAVRRR